VGGILALAVVGCGVVMELRFLIATRGWSKQTTRRIVNRFERIGWRIHSGANK
jgi:hypothetical protein|tara:strand:- start:596 stop:754 length:159 start_codon:yes stop_codon:yes gene_type:complete